MIARNPETKTEERTTDCRQLLAGNSADHFGSERVFWDNPRADRKDLQIASLRLWILQANVGAFRLPAARAEALGLRALFAGIWNIHRIPSPGLRRWDWEKVALQIGLLAARCLEPDAGLRQ